jgi:S-adenosylmethionine hydrolase
MSTPSAPGTVYFLSDFGTEDEFVGVVHAVITTRAPGTTVIDLTHHIPPFDVRAGSHTLMRAVPHLGPGVVLGVVDPGVGTVRRGIGLEVWLPAGGTMHFVGPDNGLLVAAAEAAGEAPITAAVELYRDPVPPDRGATFDGRDVFAPASSSLCTGTPLAELGEAIDPTTLVRLMGGVVETGRLHDGRACLRAEVTWVDHFGNLQLAATVADARVAGIPSTGTIELAARVESGREYLDGLPHSLVPDGVQLRCVEAFGDLKQGEFGLLVDANGHLAVVAGEASAAHWLNVVAGELLILAW